VQPAGYSGTPLGKKLGITRGHVVWISEGPDYLAEFLANEIEAIYTADTPPVADVILLFANSMKEFSTRFGSAAERLAQNGGLWACWPKKSSGVQTDLTENLVRDFGLAYGLVDNKVCAVDETWSGLRFVIRVKDRK
jgi:hypothetical protein